jgi:hypothetical protein
MNFWISTTKCGSVHIVNGVTIPHIKNMNSHEQYRLARYFILGIAFGGIIVNWPVRDIAMFSFDNLVFIAFVMIFSFLLARWCLR